ncbi:MAG TPA: hypothetical protein PLP29_17480 [Candidatus Ozemobacteraceae bacterium]|nr:hypothetical protein [Candidatus Ozemobacteraceae bacterium]
MSRIWFWGLAAVLCVQAATWPPLHGFTTDQWGAIAFGMAVLALLIGRPHGPGVALPLLVAVATWRFWSLLTPWAWSLSDLVRLAGSITAQAFLDHAGIAAEGLRFGDVLVAADPAKTLTFPLLLLWVFLVLDRLHESGPVAGLRHAAVSGTVLLGFAVLRWPLWAAFLATLQPDLVTHGWQVFWGFGLTGNMVILLLPAAPLITATDPLPSCEEDSPAPTGTPAGTGIEFRLWLFFLILVIAALPFLHPDPARTDAAIAVDATHSDWEPIPAAQPDATLDAMLAENNFGPWLEALGNVAPALVITGTASAEPWSRPGVGNTRRSLTEVLTTASPACRLLIVKCPTRPYTPAETSAVMEWVASGGVLLAIGEHTDVFFMNGFVNALVASSGLSLASDGICDHRGRWLVTGGALHAPLPWAPSAGPWMWATGASVRGGLAQLPLAVSSPDAFSDPWQPSNRNFFGNLAPDLSHLYGPFVLSTAVQYGSGLVLVHGDSTNFNADMLSTPGKLAWTRRIASTVLIDPQIAIAVLLAELLLVVFAVLSVGSCRRIGRDTLGILVALIMSFWCLSDFWLALIARPADLRASAEPRIALDATLEPGIGMSYGHQQVVTNPVSLGPVLVRLQNEGFGLSCITSDLARSLGPDVRGLILAEPRQSCTAATLGAIRSWVAEGGRLILFSRRQAGGPCRAIALGLGLSEAPLHDDPTRFPGIVSPGCHSPEPDLELPAVQHRLGNGSVTLFEDWEPLSGTPVSATATARLLSRILGS